MVQTRSSTVRLRDVSDDNSREALFRGKSVIFHILSWYTYLNLEMRFKKNLEMQIF